MEAAIPSPGVPSKKPKSLAFFHTSLKQVHTSIPRVLATSQKLHVQFIMETTKYSEIFLSIVLIIFRHIDQRIGTKLNGTISKGKTTRQHFLTNTLKLQQSSNVPRISSIETPIGKTIVDDERANPPCWLVVAIRGSLDASRFSRRVDTLFKIFSKFLFTRMCFLYPKPLLQPAVYASEEKNRVQSFFVRI